MGNNTEYGDYNLPPCAKCVKYDICRETATSEFANNDSDFYEALTIYIRDMLNKQGVDCRYFKFDGL